jgi:hypothetical protein
MGEIVVEEWSLVAGDAVRLLPQQHAHGSRSVLLTLRPTPFRTDRVGPPDSSDGNAEGLLVTRRIQL